MLKSLQKAFKVKEVRDRLLYTFMMLVVIRIGCCLPIPGVDPSYLHDFFSNLQNSGMGFFNAITGGSFSSMSIFALSITPYITSSIIMQLLTIAIPKLEEMQKEQERHKAEGLSEEELEVYDLLVRGKKLTQEEEQKVKLAAKNLFKKLTEEKTELLVVDWYKDDQPRMKVKSAIEYALNEDLPDSYDKDSFDAKTNLLLNHFIDMAIQGYGWIAA